MYRLKTNLTVFDLSAAFYTIDHSILWLCPTFTWTIFTANLTGIASIFYEVIKHLLFSWFWSVWPWMKVNVNIINMWCKPMAEAVIETSLTMITSQQFPRNRKNCRGDTHTRTRTHGLGSTLKFAKFQTKSCVVMYYGCLLFPEPGKLPEFPLHCIGTKKCILSNLN